MSTVVTTPFTNLELEMAIFGTQTAGVNDHRRLFNRNHNSDIQNLNNINTKISRVITKHLFRTDAWHESHTSLELGTLFFTKPFTKLSDLKKLNWAPTGNFYISLMNNTNVGWYLLANSGYFDYETNVAEFCNTYCPEGIYVYDTKEIMEQVLKLIEKATCEYVMPASFQSKIYRLHEGDLNEAIYFSSYQQHPDMARLGWVKSLGWLLANREVDSVRVNSIVLGLIEDSLNPSKGISDLDDLHSAGKWDDTLVTTKARNSFFGGLESLDSLRTIGYSVGDVKLSHTKLITGPISNVYHPMTDKVTLLYSDICINKISVEHSGKTNDYMYITKNSPEETPLEFIGETLEETLKLKTVLSDMITGNVW